MPRQYFANFGKGGTMRASRQQSYALRHPTWEDLLEAAAEGELAHENGVKLLENPYPRETAKWRAWRTGWLVSQGEHSAEA